MQVFGYGSLVNRATHPHGPARRLTLRGWRRAWVQTGLRPAAYLTVLPDPSGRLDGLALPVAPADRAGLLAREAAYDAVRQGALTIFTIPPGKHPPASAPQPILLSYLDAVVQGYLTEFGPEGVARFFATTAGWQTPVLDDRAAPRYPRHQPLTAPERALVDSHLDRLGTPRRAL
jgi:hypothetical protein